MNVDVWKCSVCTHIELHKHPTMAPFQQDPSHCGYPMTPNGITTIMLHGEDEPKKPKQ